MTFISIQNLTFRYSSRQDPVIDGFSLDIRQGEIVGILGSSGSGKSTLLRLVAGLEIPSSGKIVIDGHAVVDEHRVVPAEKRGVGMVFQDYALFPHLTVKQNIMFGLHRMSRTQRQKRMKEMLELVRLQEYADRYPHELSGGQQQRVALARSLAPRPALLLLDEPFSNLDEALKASIRSELRRILRQAEMTCLLVSHDRADIEAICDRSVTIGIPAAALA
jgi:iron(III) transport system ATP-binding protein